MEETKSNTLYYTHPELREEWGGDIEEMKTVSSGSHKKVMWKCKTEKECHKYCMIINNKTISKQGCPYCSNRKICSKINCWCNSLYTTNPELREEWGGDIEEMKTLSVSSNKKVSWKCKTGNICHIWNTSVNSRTGKISSGCPYCSNRKICSKINCWCNSLYTTNPELREEWVGNIDEMKTIAPSTGKKKQWKCKTGNKCHIWTTTIDNRVGKNSGCPYCSNHKICSKINCWCNSLYTTNHELREQWNGDIEEMKKLSCGSNKKVSWKCKTGNICHIWLAWIYDITNENSGCPYCSNHKICSKINCWCNSLYITNPELREEWNGDIDDMKKISQHSGKKVEWKCKNNFNHIWLSTVDKRTSKQKRGCPMCINKTEGILLSFLQSIYPDIIHQYKTEFSRNPETNKNFPYDFYIPSKDLIIELDGRQHFSQVINWKNPEEQLKRDTFKTRQALLNNLHIIRIFQEDVFEDTIDWRSILTEKINQLEQSYRQYYISKNDIYGEHTRMLENIIL